MSTPQFKKFSSDYTKPIPSSLPPHLKELVTDLSQCTWTDKDGKVWYGIIWDNDNGAHLYGTDALYILIEEETDEETVKRVRKEHAFWNTYFAEEQRRSECAHLLEMETDCLWYGGYLHIK